MVRLAHHYYSAKYELVRLFAHHPEQRRRTALMFFAVAVVSVLAGCESRVADEKLKSEKKGLSAKAGELLTVDFQQDQTLRYKFTSTRDIVLDWDPGKKQSKPGKSSIEKSGESVEIVVAYTPIEVDPFGLTTIKATCESVKTRRSKNPQKDAVESLAGKTFTFTVGPTGIIDDYSQLTKLIKDAGKKAFRADTSRGKIKDPDLIGEFTTSQWFLWDSISSIDQAAGGVLPGRTWESVLPVTGPMVMRRAREVKYTLAEIRQSKKGRLAVIRSSYSPAESIPENWAPMPYSGRFQMRGTFGFLRGYQILELQGQGEELFNIDAGRIENYNQQYQVILQAVIPFGIDVKPQITMKQKFTMQLLE